MNKQAILHECVARHARDILNLFPKKVLTWYAIPFDEIDRIQDFANEYFEDVSDILLEMAVECIEIEKKFQKKY